MSPLGQVRKVTAGDGAESLFLPVRPGCGCAGVSQLTLLAMSLRVLVRGGCRAAPGCLADCSGIGSSGVVAWPGTENVFLPNGLTFDDEGQQPLHH